MKNKKDYIIDVLRKENIDICMIQEADIPKDYPYDILSSKDYKIECQRSTIKARCVALIKNDINYVRRTDLEGEDDCLIILDVKGIKNYRLINVYRTFTPPFKHSFER